MLNLTAIRRARLIAILKQGVTWDLGAEDERI